MAMTQDEALKLANRLVTTSHSSRAAYEAICGVNLAYAYGNQWADVGRGKTGGDSVRQLKTIIDPGREDVRFAMNYIRPRIVKLDSRLKPKTLDFTVQPASRASNDQVAALVADARIRQHLEETGALRCIRMAFLWRLVLGSAVVRRSMRPVGDEVMVRDAAGTPINGKNGKPASIRSFRHEWACCPPYEFIRDPSVLDVDLNNDEVIGHEKPRPTSWLKRQIGVSVDTDAKMGQLLEFQTFLSKATGQSMAAGYRDSEEPGVLASEWWFKDADDPSPNQWRYWMLAYRDVKGEGADDRELKVLDFKANPYVDLPLHHFWYNVEVTAPWGRGVPATTIQAQNVLNLAYVSMIRRVITHANPKYVVEQNSLADDMARALSNRTDVPIVYKRGSSAPTRLDPGPMDPTVATIMQDSPKWLDAMLNMSPVQAGHAVARGEAAKAYEVRQEAADTPITSVADDDEPTMNDLLTGTLHDVMKTESVKSLHERLSHEFTPQQIMTLKSQDTRVSLAGVKLVPDTLRPRTPDQMRADAVDAINSQMVDPVTARRSLLVEGRMTLDVKEGRAYRLQLLENQTLLDGEEVEAMLQQDHGMHQWVIEMECESPRMSAYTPEQKEALMEHWRQHDELNQVRQQLNAPPQEMAPEEPIQAGPEGMNQEMPEEGSPGVLPFPAGGGAEAGASPLSGVGMPGAGLAAAFA